MAHAFDLPEIQAFGAIFDVVLSDDVAKKIGVWLELLKTWNKKLDLTAAKTQDDLLDVMLADAFVLAKHLPNGARVVDVGSGAGAPGLPLAIARPDLSVTLVEPLTKRVSFLRTAIAAIERTDVQLRRVRADELSQGAWDAAISRATFSPEAWLTLGAELVNARGEIWALLAKEEAPILDKISQMETVAYAWPRGGHARRAVRYVKKSS